jgi:hypothetical protein
VTQPQQDDPQHSPVLLRTDTPPAGACDLVDRMFTTVATDTTAATNVGTVLHATGAVLIKLIVFGAIACCCLGLIEHLLTWRQACLSLGGIGALGVTSWTYRILRSRLRRTGDPTPPSR